MHACAEHAHTHAGDTRSLRSLVCSSFPPFPLHKCAPRTPLARYARSLFPPFPLQVNVPSSPPPTPALATLAWASCLLRTGETPVLRRQGLGKGCAIGHLPPQALHSLRCPSHSLATLARCRSVPPTCYRYGGRARNHRAHTPPLSQSGSTTL